MDAPTRRSDGKGLLWVESEEVSLEELSVDVGCDIDEEEVVAYFHMRDVILAEAVCLIERVQTS